MKKKCIKFIITMLVLLLITTNVKAIGFEFSVSSNKTSVAPGEEIEITLAVSNIDLGENKMNTIEGIIDYDKDVFEEIKSSNITSLNNWSITYNDENTDLNGKFLGIVLNDGVKENQSIATVKFKIKPGIKSQTTQIIIKNIASNDGTNLVEEGDKIVEIKIVNPDDEKQNTNNTINNTIGNTTGNTAGNTTDNSTNGNNNNTNNNITNNKININNTNSSRNTNKSNTTTVSSRLPDTGSSDIYIIAAIILFVVIGVISYFRYRKM